MQTLKRGALMLCLLCALPASAAEVAGIKFDDSIKAASGDLLLNGAGLRKKLLFKVYAVGLYLGSKSTSTAEVYQAKGNKRIQLVTLRELSAEQLAEALEKGVEANTPPAEMGKIKARLDEFRAYLLALDKLPEGSQVRIDWNGTATQVFVAGNQKGKDIAGVDFYNALLGIWLGEAPVQDDLKAALLGKS